MLKCNITILIQNDLQKCLSVRIFQLYCLIINKRVKIFFWNNMWVVTYITNENSCVWLLKNCEENHDGGRRLRQQNMKTKNESMWKFRPSCLCKNYETPDCEWSSAHFAHAINKLRQQFAPNNTWTAHDLRAPQKRTKTKVRWAQ